MALTKHQRLARVIKQTFGRLESFFDKVAQFLDVLQFHFYEKKLILGRPLMSNGALKAMMLTHKRGLVTLAPDKELRVLCASKPLIGAIVSSPIQVRSQTLTSQCSPSDALWVVPWGVKIVLPQDILQLLQIGRAEAVLYCASEEEMSEWIDWFEEEDRARSLTNQLFSILAYEKEHQYEHTILKHNLEQMAFPHFKKFAIERGGNLPSAFQQRKANSFFPDKDFTVSQAYQAVTQSLKSREERYHDGLKIDWRARLEELMFDGLHWTCEEQRSFINDGMIHQKSKGNKLGIRWATSLAIDRATYASFVQHFAERFLENPLARPMDGEIVCLIWIMVYFAQCQTTKPALHTLLDLTTEHLKGRILLIDGQEIEISTGLSRILDAYVGPKPTQRQQKLFPHLSIDNLEDRFRKASQELLPTKSSPVLPEAFLTFPHNLGSVRILPALRRQMQASPPRIYNVSTSWRAIKSQLLAEKR